MVIEVREAAPSKQKLSRQEARQKAMSDPVRRAILLHIVEQGMKSPKEVSDELGKELGVVSYHIRKLAEYDCVELVKTEPVRGSTKHFYVATERHVVDVAEFEALDPLERGGILVDVTQPIIDDFTGSMKAGLLGSDGQFHITRIPLKALDGQGKKEMLEAHMDLYDRTYEIETRAAERMAESGEAPIKMASAQMCFEVEGF